MVSHDRYFLNRVCNGILAFEGDGQIFYSVGDYDYYLEKRARNLSANKKELRPATTTDKISPELAVPSRPRKLTWKEARELEGMEAKIIEVENEIARIEALFAQPDYHQEHGANTPQLVAELESARENLAGLYSRWEELESIQAASKKS
jgi:ATP-binding cassette subfamily F protein uup